MKTNYLEMVKYCDDLTKNGQKLSITWNGGNDSGAFEICLDDEPIENSLEVEEDIIQFIDDHLDYGSFAGDFSTDGEVVYDRETKTFEGIDTYSESSMEAIECSIEVRVSKEIWFDRMEISVSLSNDHEEGFINLEISNGPRLNAHASFEEQIDESLKQTLREIMGTLYESFGINLNKTISYDEFSEEGEELLFIIKELDNSIYASDDKDISICLTE